MNSRVRQQLLDALGDGANSQQPAAKLTELTGENWLGGYVANNGVEKLSRISGSWAAELYDGGATHHMVIRPEAIVVQTEGTYLVTMEVPGQQKAQVPFKVDQPEKSDIFAVQLPTVITEVTGPDTCPVRALFHAVGGFHRAARPPRPGDVAGGRRPARLRALRINQGPGYVGTVELPGGEMLTATFVVQGSIGEQWTVPLPESLRSLAGPDDVDVEQVLQAVADFHKAVQAQA